jgi:hypothetical protein
MRAHRTQAVSPAARRASLRVMTIGVEQLPGGGDGEQEGAEDASSDTSTSFSAKVVMIVAGMAM